MSEVEADNTQEIEEIDQGPALPSGGLNEKAIEGQELPVEIVNGFPMYKEMHVLGGRCQIFERIGWNDRVGPTYLAMGADDKELILRVGSDDCPIVKIEAAFLCLADQENLWRHFSQVHQIWHQDDYYFLSLYFRGGPTLRQCFEFSKEKFTHGSAARLALDVLQILRSVHKLGYLARDLALEKFHFDACSRHLFMADISTIVKDTTKIADIGTPSANWIGGPLFAPIAHHDGDAITCRDELEAWFYQFVYLHTGTLPWALSKFEDLKWDKITAINNKTLFQGLPIEYNQLYNLITKEMPEVAVTEADYDTLEKITTRIFQEIGGIKDHEENFDYEREPTEEELPRFVMEKIPVQQSDTPTDEVKEEESIATEADAASQE